MEDCLKQAKMGKSLKSERNGKSSNPLSTRKKAARNSFGKFLG